jgi:hypothetical protein
MYRVEFDTWLELVSMLLIGSKVSCFFNERAQCAYFIDIVGEYKPGSGKVKDLQVN